MLSMTFSEDTDLLFSTAGAANRRLMSIQLGARRSIFLWSGSKWLTAVQSKLVLLKQAWQHGGMLDIDS